MELLTFLKKCAPCYVYDQETVIAQCETLKSALKGFDFLYSIKTNPFAGIIRDVYEQGFGADAASAQEVAVSAKNGMEAQQIFYSTPGKTEEDIANCYGKCVMTADSFWDVRRMNDEARRHKEIARIGVRVNPDFSMGGAAAGASKFGIDVGQLPELQKVILECSNIQVVGLHIHIRSQVLDYNVLGDYYLKCYRLAENINQLEGVTLEFINFGSGIGALYDDAKEKPLDLEKLSLLVSEIVSENAQTLKAKLYIETGRFVVCSAGIYYTRIVDIKISHGTKYLIVQNAMNGFLRPAIACLLHKNAGRLPLPGQEPLYTSQHQCSVRVLNENTSVETVTVVGNLCTPLDVVCEDVELNRAEIGDIVAITNAGSYSYSLSPLLFSSHEPPGQYYRTKENSIIADPEQTLVQI